MTDEEAIKKARQECSKASYLEECGENAGIRAIYSKKAEWLSRVIYLAEHAKEE